MDGSGEAVNLFPDCCAWGCGCPGGAARCGESQSDPQLALRPPLRAGPCGGAVACGEDRPTPGWPEPAANALFRPDAPRGSSNGAARGLGSWSMCWSASMQTVSPSVARARSLTAMGSILTAPRWPIGSADHRPAGAVGRCHRAPCHRDARPPRCWPIRPAFPPRSATPRRRFRVARQGRGHRQHLDRDGQARCCRYSRRSADTLARIPDYKITRAGDLPLWCWKR